MMGLEGVVLNGSIAEWAGLESGAALYLFTIREWAWLALLAGVAFFMPNVQQIVAREGGGLMPETLVLKASRLQWRPTAVWALGLGLCMAWALLGLNRVDEFLYFQF